MYLLCVADKACKVCRVLVLSRQGKVGMGVCVCVCAVNVTMAGCKISETESLGTTNPFALQMLLLLLPAASAATAGTNATWTSVHRRCYLPFVSGSCDQRKSQEDVESGMAVVLGELGG